MVNLLRKHCLQGFLHLRHVLQHCRRIFAVDVAYLLHDTEDFLLFELLSLYNLLQCLHRQFHRWLVLLQWTWLIREDPACLFGVAYSYSCFMIPRCASRGLRPTA